MSDITQGQDAAPEKPDVDTLFGAKDVDTLFPADYKPTDQPVRNVSPIQDMIFSNPGRSHARVLDAFGYGFKQDWGAGNAELSEADDALRKAGVYNDYAKGQRNIIKAANEAVMRPAVAALLAAKSAASGVFHGGQEAVAQMGAEAGAPSLGREIASIPEAFPAGLHQMAGIPHVPEIVTHAKSLDTIGSGEAGYFGTAPVEAEPAKAAAEAAKVQDVAKPEPLSGKDAEAAPSPVAPPPAPAAEPADIHAVARQIAPETFQEFDTLAEKKDTFRRWISELREVRDQTAREAAPHGPEIADLEQKLQDATPRLAKKYQARLDPLVAERDAYIAEHTQADSTDMAKVRGQLMSTDYRMRDLSGDVAKAYRDAQERMPQAEAAEAPPAEAVAHEEKPVEAVPGQAPVAGEAAAEPVTAPAPAEAKPAKQLATPSQPEALIKGAEKGAQFAGKQAIKPDTPEEAARLPIAHAPSIIADVSQKLVSAGRPTEEAQAAAQVVASYWETRAQRFEGKKGTAAEMYAAEAPEIKAGKEKPSKSAKAHELELAQKGRSYNQEPPQTEAFQKWFGDSKIVDDATGKPAVVYHGTGSPIEQFDLERAGSNLDSGFLGKGIYLTDKPATADYYASVAGRRSGAESVIPLFASIQKPFQWGNKRQGARGLVFRGERLPEEIHDAVIERSGFKFDPSAELSDTGPADEARLADAIRSVLIERGYDGVIAEVGGQKEIVAFHPEQLKSAIGNRGTFDVSSSNILHQGVNGRIRVRDDARNTITLMKKADASTFIHETGHDWLDRMLDDARDEEAPASLRADSDTVMKWLGVDSPDGIKTRHHEKFARGFETYMMEGRAPSQALARVFAKFKAWLTTIYRTVAALKAPISDDIRGVFDRLLTETPEKTVIAPERETKGGLAETHEELAATTPPERSHQVASTIEAERDSHADRTLVKAGDHDTRLTDTGAETEGRAPGSAQSAGDANAPGPVSSGSPESGRTGALSAGGSEVAGEGTGVRKESAAEQLSPTAERSGGPTTDEFPLDANVRMPAAPTLLMDKAGNIRLENLNTTDDVKQVIRDSAARNGGFVEARRDTISDQEGIKLAQAMGMKVEDLNYRKIGEAWNKEQIFALEGLFIKASTAVRDAMAMGDELAYAESVARFQMIQETVQSHASGVRAEAGRALQAYSVLKKMAGRNEAYQLADVLQVNSGKTLYQMRKEMQLGLKLETPADIAEYVNKVTSPTYKDMAIEAWMSCLLSGLRTHVANILGNSLTTILRPIETATAAGIGKVRNIVTGTEDRVLIGEAHAELFGMVQGAHEGITAATKAFLTEEPQLTATLQAERKYQHAIPGVTGQIIRTPMRLLGAEDEFFKAVAFRGDIYRQAATIASKENLPSELMRQRIADLSKNPTEEMIAGAKKVADYQTFQNALGKTGQAISAFSNSHPLAKVIVPFVRTPLNLLKYANERSPMGVFAQEVRDNLWGNNGARARDTQIARMALGTMVGVTAFSYAAQGIITGGGPADKGKKAIMMANGWQPYSVKVGDMYYSYNRLDPLSVTLGVAADAYEIMSAAGAEHPDKEHLLSLTFAAITKNILNRTALQGISDINQAASDPDRYFKNYVKGLIGSLVPAISAQSAQSLDPIVREARGIIDNLKARTPFMSQTLMSKRDVWGEPIMREGALGPDIASPIAESKIKNDPVNKALLDAGYFPSKVERKIRGIDLTDQQYDDFARMAGRMAKMRLNAYVNTPGISMMPAQVRADQMRKIVDSARESARSIVLMQNPDIITKANAAKAAKFHPEPAH